MRISLWSWLVFGVLLVAPARAQLPVSAGVSMSVAEHRVTAGAGLERSSGTMFGFWGTTTLRWRSVDARGALRVGSLGANDPAAVDRDVGELALGARLPLSPLLGLDAGVVVRRYESSLAAQRWAWGEIGVHGHTSVLDSTLTLSAGLSIMPWVSVTGVSRPDLAVAAQSAVSYTTGRLSATMRYRLERFDFPARQGVRRLEELSALELGVAWRLRGAR